MAARLPAGTVLSQENLRGLRPMDRLRVCYEGEEAKSHDRILLSRISTSRWVILTPHYDIYDECILEYAVCVVAGPRGGVNHHISRYEHISFDWREVAKELGEYAVTGEDEAVALRAPGYDPTHDHGTAVLPVVATGTVTPPAEPEWQRAPLRPTFRTGSWIMLEDRCGQRVGDVVPTAWDTLSVSDGRALVLAPDGKACAAALVGDATFNGASNDLRTLPIRYNADGNRDRSYAEGVSLLSESDFSDWSMDGPRTTKWVLGAIVSGDSTPIKRHYWWRQVLGLRADDFGVNEHEFLSTMLETSVCYDQLNVGELLCFEHLSRRLQLIEESRAEALRTATMGTSGGMGAGHVDNEEQDLFLGRKHARHSALVSPALQEWVAGKIAQTSAVRKERRKGREERQLAASSATAGTGNEGHGAPGGRPKAKGKGKEH